MKGIKTASDKTFLGIVLILTVGGFFIFVSASLGLLARGAVSLSSVVFNQLILGVVGGMIALYCAMRTNYNIWREYAPHLFVLAAILTSLVFVPHIGFATKGAARWLLIGPFTVQPAEMLKLATVILAAWYIPYAGKKIRESTVWSVGGVAAILAVPAVLLLLQPDIDVLVIITLTVCGMFFCAGMRWRDIGICVLGAIIALAGIVYMKPHVQQRLMTFLHPEANVRSSGYQIRQSTIAVGSGGLFGRGFGQSVQKFGYLPEPIGDSVFAVFAEEFGFVGCIILLSVFLAFAAKGFLIALNARDLFGALLAFGIVYMITVQSFMNIGSLLSILPLSGNPLVFVSHGGTALAIALLSVGIVLNISKHKRIPGKS
jgi:cell division protein FtsW